MTIRPASTLWPTQLLEDRRGRVHLVDVLLSFATMVTLVGVLGFVWVAIRDAMPHVDPLSATLLRLTPVFFVVALYASLHVSAATN